MKTGPLPRSDLSWLILCFPNTTQTLRTTTTAKIRDAHPEPVFRFPDHLDVDLADATADGDDDDINNQIVDFKSKAELARSTARSDLATFKAITGGELPADAQTLRIEATGATLVKLPDARNLTLRGPLALIAKICSRDNEMLQPGAAGAMKQLLRAAQHFPRWLVPAVWRSWSRVNVWAFDFRCAGWQDGCADWSAFSSPVIDR